MKFACTRCGSRNWPDPDSSCPLCRDDREELNESTESAARDAGQNSQSKQTNDMKKTLNTGEIARELHRDDSAAWSWNGALALAEYLQEYEEQAGEEMELDVCAIRCDFSESTSLQDWLMEHHCTGTLAFALQRSGIDLRGDEDEDETNDLIRSYIQDYGTLIEFNGGIIVSSF